MCKNYHDNTAACMYIIKFEVLIINLLFKKTLALLFRAVREHWYLLNNYLQSTNCTVHALILIDLHIQHTFVYIYINTRSSLMNSELFSFTNCIAMEFLMLLTVPVLKCTGHLLNCPMSVVIFWPYETDA